MPGLMRATARWPFEVGRTERCANWDDLEILTLAGVAIAV
jgi:hypothetical protein